MFARGVSNFCEHKPWIGCALRLSCQGFADSVWVACTDEKPVVTFGNANRQSTDGHWKDRDEWAGQNTQIRRTESNRQDGLDSPNGR